MRIPKPLNLPDLDKITDPILKQTLKDYSTLIEENHRYYYEDSALRVITIVDGDTTPAVSWGAVYKTANTNPTTITTFDEGFPGQKITIIFGDANTTINETDNIILNDVITFTGAANQVIRFTYDGTNWLEITKPTQSDFRSGDMMLSANATPPTGWTDRSGTYNTRFIRISSGATKSTGGANTHTHTGPSHTHAVGSYACASHTHTIPITGYGTSGAYCSPGDMQVGMRSNVTWSYKAITAPASGATAPAVAGTSAAGGTGNTGSGDNVPTYVTLELFEKD